MMSDLLRKLAYRILPGLAIGLCIVVLCIDYLFSIPVQKPIFYIIPAMLFLIFLGRRQ